jgi:hypothetical protein
LPSNSPRASVFAFLAIATVPGLAAQAPSAAAAAADAPIAGVRHVIGLENVKLQGSGSLSVQSGALLFDAGKSQGRVPIASIDDIFVGSETTRAGGKTAGVVALAAPYGSGRLLSLLLRTKVDIFTVSYHDANGGVHGAIFATPKGLAAGLQTQLRPAAARADAPPSAATALAVAPGDTKPVKLTASAIQIQPIEAGAIDIPAEFQFAIYERLIERVQHDGEFQKVFRGGDHEAKDIPDLVVLHTTILGFKEGSEIKREVTTVAGGTAVAVTATITKADGSVLSNHDLTGKVRFFGENLGVTNDLAKRIAKILRESF